MNSMPNQNWLKAGAGVAAVAGVLVGVRLLPVGRWAQLLIEKVHGLGARGVAIFAAVYIVSPLLLAPASLLTIGAGFLYGRASGTLLVAACATAAA